MLKKLKKLLINWLELKNQPEPEQHVMYFCDEPPEYDTGERHLLASLASTGLNIKMARNAHYLLVCQTMNGRANQDYCKGFCEAVNFIGNISESIRAEKEELEEIDKKEREEGEMTSMWK